MNKLLFYTFAFSSFIFLTSCTDDNNGGGDTPDEPKEADIPEEEWYAGGELGTSFVVNGTAYQQPAPAVDKAGMGQSFQVGERFFERDFQTGQEGAFAGLGPVYVRPGCLYCHPSYGHGKRQTSYSGTTMGNGYLLVVYDKSTDAYLMSVAGMPQTLAVAPFKAPIDEKKIKIDWMNYTDDWGNKFDDGESYSLIYPEVTIPADAYYAPLIAKRNGANVEIGVDEVGVRLESTIGVYGVGLIDAIPDDSIAAEWARQEAKGYKLNTSMFENGQWKNYYGGKYVRKYTYALSRGPLQDAPGANAIWNITNVTRSDRRYHYLDLNYNAKSQTLSYYAQTSSKDPDVQKEFYNYFPEWNKTGDVEEDIYNYLTNTELPAEMTDKEYTDFMVWHRGLAVPAARDLDKEEVKRGHRLFREIGCAACHRPSWTTGDDKIEDPNGFFKSDYDLPRYPNQKIWPYSDMVQHKLMMKNDIRTGWCRTTPLWGRGLSKLNTGAEDRLHDCRARNTMEAIMWHGSKDSDARWSVENFRKLSKKERDAVVKFIDSI
ncbi:MAG: hypothetical protein MJZ69_06640 [Bacteroidaceae bacterium]|nr:hypothetical protein [Bacteroidaceae bacterium]